MNEKIVMVYLEDSFQSSDLSDSEARNLVVCKVMHCGFLFHENKSRVVISNFTSDGEIDTITIPKRTILKIIELKEGKTLFKAKDCKGGFSE